MGDKNNSETNSSAESLKLAKKAREKATIENAEKKRVAEKLKNTVMPPTAAQVTSAPKNDDIKVVDTNTTPSVNPNKTETTTPEVATITPKDSNALDGDFKNFETQLQTQKLTPDTLLKALQDISAYKAPEGKDGTSAQNGYLEVVLNHVIANSDLLLPTYLAALTPSTISYLGADKATQVKLYTTLINSETCKKLISEGNKTRDDLMSVKLAIEKIDPTSVKEGMKQDLDKVIGEIGGVLLGIIELFGGKGSLKSFCDKFNINYNKYFSSIEKLYNDTYQLDPNQTASLQSIYASIKDEDFATKKDNDSSGRGWDTTNSKQKIQDYYAKPAWVQNNFQLLDPVLIDRAMKSAKITIPNLIIPAGKQYGETTYKINEAIPVTPEQKTAIVAQLVKDPALWESISSLRSRSAATTVYGKNESEASFKWSEKLPKSPKDTAIAFGACMMKGSKDLKYVLSQSDFPYQKDHAETLANSKTEESIKTDRNTFLQNINITTGKRKDFVGKDPTKIDAAQKPEYDRYVTATVEHMTSLLAADHKEYGILLNTPVLKLPLTPLFSQQLSLYLTSLKSNTSLTEPQKAEAAQVLTQLNSIVEPKKIDFTADKILISGKDKDKKDISIDSSKFSWIKPEVVPVTT